MRWGLLLTGRPWRPWPLWLLLVALALGSLTGCGQPATAAVGGNPPDNPQAAPTATALPPTAPTLPPPALLILNTPTPPPSFAALAPEQVTQSQVEESVDAGDTAVSTTPTEAATLAPTYTPPALPFTLEEEHYWLQRPIPEGGTVWTDKVYPYGSTRGGTLRPHHGVEFYVGEGTEVLAAAAGTVVVAGADNEVVYGPHPNFYGNLVIIELDAQENGRAVYTLYAHLSQILVNEGQRVAAQDLIALSGATGIADGPHLHFEVRVGDNSYDATRNPLLWLYPFPDYGTVAGRVVRSNGSLVQEAPITLRRIDAPSRYLATTSYAGGSSLNPDDVWQENFALDDVPAGYYEISVAVGEKRFTQELWVFAYRTNFVEIMIED